HVAEAAVPRRDDGFVEHAAAAGGLRAHRIRVHPHRVVVGGRAVEPHVSSHHASCGRSRWRRRRSIGRIPARRNADDTREEENERNSWHQRGPKPSGGRRFFVAASYAAAIRNSSGSPNGRAMKSTPTGSAAGIGPTSRVSLPLPTRSRSQTLAVKPAGTSITGNPCWPNMNQPIGLRPLLFGSRGDSSFLGGTVDIGATSASSFCSVMQWVSSVCNANRVCIRAEVSNV